MKIKQNAMVTMTKFYVSVGKINSYSSEYNIRVPTINLYVRCFIGYVCVSNSVCLCCMTYLRSVHRGKCTWHSVFIDFIAYRNHAHKLTNSPEWYRTGGKRKKKPIPVNCIAMYFESLPELIERRYVSEPELA